MSDFHSFNYIIKFEWLSKSQSHLYCNYLEIVLGSIREVMSVGLATGGFLLVMFCVRFQCNTLS